MCTSKKGESTATTGTERAFIHISGAMRYTLHEEEHHNSISSLLSLSPQLRVPHAFILLYLLLSPDPPDPLDSFPTHP